MLYTIYIRILLYTFLSKISLRILTSDAFLLIQKNLISEFEFQFRDQESEHKEHFKRQDESTDNYERQSYRRVIFYFIRIISYYILTLFISWHV